MLSRTSANSTEFRVSIRRLPGIAQRVVRPASSLAATVSKFPPNWPDTLNLLVMHSHLQPCPETPQPRR